MRGPAIMLAALLLVPVIALGASALLPPGWGRAPSSFAPLNVSASAVPPYGVIPLTVTFVANASGGWPPYTYDWTFGDGSPNSTGPNVTHVYHWVAAFVANVSVTDSVGEISTVSVGVATAPLPLAVVVSALPSTVGVHNVTYLETSVQGGTAPFQYAWSGLPGGCVALPVENLSCSPTQGGTFTIHVVVTDGLGQHASSSALLLVTGGTGVAPPSDSGGANTLLAPLWWGAIGLVVVAAIIAALRVRRRRRRGVP